MRVRVIVDETNSVKHYGLTIGNVYRVIGIEADDYRIMSDEGLPCLYPPEIFTVIDLVNQTTG